MTPSVRIFLALSLLLTSKVHGEEPAALFIKSHCLRCHGTLTQKADRRFDNLAPEIQTLDELERYQEIVDQLNLEAMPPEKEPQPTLAQRAMAIKQLTEKIKTARE